MTATSISSKPVVVLGHTLADYMEMFNLETKDLQKSILDCGPGPASFNAECYLQGRQVISCDELFAQSASTIESHITDVFQLMLHQVKQQPDRFIWKQIGSHEQFAQIRQQGINLFLQDYPQGKEQGRYLAESLDALPFQHSDFQLALCSHYLFGNRCVQDIELQTKIIMEMSRVAEEVRIFPLIDNTGAISPLLGPIMLGLQERNLGVEIREVNYQFQKNDNALLRVWASQCKVA